MRQKLIGLKSNLEIEVSHGFTNTILRLLVCANLEMRSKSMAKDDFKLSCLDVKQERRLEVTG